MPGGSVPPQAGARWVLLSSPGLRDGRRGRDRTPPVSSAVVTPSEGAGAAPQPAPQPAPSLLPPPASRLAAVGHAHQHQAPRPVEAVSAGRPQGQGEGKERRRTFLGLRELEQGAGPSTSWPPPRTLGRGGSASPFLEEPECTGRHQPCCSAPGGRREATLGSKVWPHGPGARLCRLCLQRPWRPSCRRAEGVRFSSLLLELALRGRSERGPQKTDGQGRRGKRPCPGRGTPGRRRGRVWVSAARPVRPRHAMPLWGGTGLPAGDGLAPRFRI